MKSAQAIARICKVLGAEARVRIVQLLRDHAQCVGALAAGLEITQGAVSQHLRILRDAGLITSEKCGYYVHYKINEKTFQQWRGALDELLSLPASHSQGGKPCVRKKDVAVKSRTS
ncbi:MAG: winged helix-turn-helix transcriptional regulator [Planctomycetes bacterium]|nr:winged helix-turn-helix transcriptional regulator [Planctomycetota bacterium]